MAKTINNVKLINKIDNEHDFVDKLKHSFIESYRYMYSKLSGSEFAKEAEQNFLSLFENIALGNLKINF